MTKDQDRTTAAPTIPNDVFPHAHTQTSDDLVADLPAIHEVTAEISAESAETIADETARNIWQGTRDGDMISGLMPLPPIQPQDPREHLIAFVESLKAERARIDRQIAAAEALLFETLTPSATVPTADLTGHYTASTLPAALSSLPYPAPVNPSSDLTATGSIKPRKKPQWTSEGREQARNRMRAYWEQRRAHERALATHAQNERAEQERQSISQTVREQERSTPTNTPRPTQGPKRATKLRKKNK